MSVLPSAALYSYIAEAVANKFGLIFQVKLMLYVGYAVLKSTPPTDCIVLKKVEGIQPAPADNENRCAAAGAAMQQIAKKQVSMFFIL